jgi:nicotinamidase-related amidase
MGSPDLSRQFKPANTALIVIDMQNDYCSAGYYLDKAGYDIDRLRWPVAPIQRVLEAARRAGLTIIYTRQYHVPGAQEDTAGEQGGGSFPRTALKGEAGWEIIPELAPQAAETVLDKTTCSAFVSTDIQELLKSKAIGTLIFCGNTLDVCVHSTLRSANDLGYDCITLADCCGAVNDGLYEWSLESIKVENGVFGAVMESPQLIEGLSHFHGQDDLSVMLTAISGRTRPRLRRCRGAPP